MVGICEQGCCVLANKEARQEYSKNVWGLKRYCNQTERKGLAITKKINVMTVIIISVY